ncbi:hypothetical protein HDU87_001914 [Geranomyces variabilis]|uniref:Uncharacterized protein n=1 Tax=Geranomyces variabilis TaxID=109894 RepID=A0AAD5XHZ7_9FUNG|nr:hypothetical protein HDU87_001914 [Geranomyces variabilis]
MPKHNKQHTADTLSALVDDGIPTLPSPAVLATTECDELEESISFGPPVGDTPSELPLAAWEESANTTIVSSDARFYAENMLSPALRLRSKVFTMHGSKECTHGKQQQQQHARANEQVWMIEGRVLDRFSPLEERDLIFYLRRVAEDTETCIFYSRAEYGGVKIVSADPIRVDQAIVRLESLQAYLLEMIQLPIPKYDPGDERGEIPGWPAVAGSSLKNLEMLHY